MLEQNPTNAHAHVQLGKALAAIGKNQESIAHLRTAVAIDPNEEEGHYNLGFILMDANPAAAITEFQQAIRINPDHFKARSNLGVLLMEQRRFDEAEEQFKAGLRLNPKDPVLLENMQILVRNRAAR
jgi:Flp pilus assembly protein TadD